MAIKFTPGQQSVYDALMAGKNVFITGGAGTGKTTVIRQFIQDVDPECKRTLLAASTGKAALNLRIDTKNGPVYGSTVHKLFGIKAEIAPDYKGTPPKILRFADRIIIDEISMWGLGVFDCVAEALQDEQSDFTRDKPLQIILVGDFYQLPPVVKTTITEGASDKEILDYVYGCDVGKAYCFQSYAWDFLDIETHELTDIMRQKDDKAFCDALNQIRAGDVTGINYINQFSDHSPFKPDKITLCGTNKNADRINGYMLNKNPNPKYVFEWDIETNQKYIDGYLKNAPCVERLTLCEGARVICIANNEAAVNGQIGTVIKIGSDNVTVKWDSGETNKVLEYKWEITRQEIVKDKETGRTSIQSKTILTISQLPLKLAYAITIHKAQGETLESVNVYVDTFETGHLYTALSRCPSVKNIRLKRPLKPSDVLCDNAINKWYEEQRRNFK